ncbi:hypothetical protein BVRB_8g184910 [Beta vulgaris subsp. vulgaris]|uniref:Sulfotransferase n=1 Tax=Beta vulgaris subsp. vulgaris TaxID=3555 RepID=A0A0J8EMI4_BETVV|nr:cytosolic sulfotransferase 5 [Beta vulgaris subsp. vulgaris]KMT04196.1 hypothetical protein BVRB_8g184910 [Beta vulgaris subsp. vulgaris]
MYPSEAHDEVKNLVHDDEVEELKQCLPKDYIIGDLEIVKYQGFWCFADTNMFKSILMFQRHFQARESDLIVASFPKTGTTWLKSILYSVVNRFKHPIKQSPLLTNHPHELVCRLEYDIYGDAFDYPRPHHLSELPSPRLFHTHLPYVTLPESIKVSGCRILYITRNPLDTLVSMMYFAMKPLKELVGEDVELPSIEYYFEDFCEGKPGPFFEHVIEYWKQSLEQPNKVLFLKYEELKEDPILHLKRVAEFVDMPFTEIKESEGVIEEIIEFCSINNLKELEGNKNGVINKIYDKKSYFRKGEVGDWTNHSITPVMVEKMKKLMQEKLEGTGLSFQLLPLFLTNSLMVIGKYKLYSLMLS